MQIFVHTPLATSTPNLHCDQPTCRSLVEAINASQSSIDFAIYGLRGQKEVLDALVQAQARGVRVRGVVDADIHGKNYYSDTPALMQALKNIRTDQATDQRTAGKREESSGSTKCERPADHEGPLSCFQQTVGGVRYELGQASAEPIGFEGDIMHNKFFVMDGHTVWTGSANISDSDVGGYNANVVFQGKLPELAEAYTTEFEQLYNGKAHREKQVSSRRTVQLPAGGTAQVLFSPQDSAMNQVVTWLDEAQREINITIFYLTSKDVAGALLGALDRGVKVRIVMDATAAQNEYTKHELLRSAGAQVKVENWGGKMHAKAASIDGKHLIIGSMNWTSAGQYRNDENTLFLRDVPAFAEQYNAGFGEMWSSIPETYLTINPRPEGTESGYACQDAFDNDYDGKTDQEDPECVSAPPAGTRAVPQGKSCPPEFPIKGNADSMIFHVPSGKYYAKTTPEDCFSTPDAAQNAGYRQSKE